MQIGSLSVLKVMVLLLVVRGVGLTQGFSGEILIPPALYAIEGSPFTANIESIRIETLADQTHINHRILSRVLRDSAGRQRFEIGKDEAFYPSQSPPDIRIYDVVERTIIHLNAVNSTASIDPIDPTHATPASTEPIVWIKDLLNERKEKLPPQQIAGLMAEGTRTIYTIPAGREGNDRDLQVIDELWISPLYRVALMHVHDDPRHGRVVIRVIGFIASEPEARLFQIPTGYKVLDRRSGTALPTQPSSRRSLKLKV